MGGGAGIGGGFCSGCGTITINGGTITATGKATSGFQYPAEGIGRSDDVAGGGNINSNGNFSITYGTDKDHTNGPNDLSWFLLYRNENRSQSQYVYLTQKID